ncbi:hypothetical protein [Streptomyces sp. NPDC059009]|uniref:hypothetical protein n=1 Tax=Streptomyces sp. NPDC059009 TaxID=3346694 RepID=UPI00368F9687
MKEPGTDRLARLTELAQTLIDEVAELAGENGAQLVTLTKRSRTNRRMILVTLASLVLDVALTVTMALGLVRVDHNADRIDSLTHRLDVAQSDTRRKAFCPLYTIFLSSKSAQGRKAAADPKAYDHAFDVIEEGYKALNCGEFIDDAQPPFTEAPKS